MARDDGAAEWMGPLPAAAGCDCHVCRPADSLDDLERRSVDTVLEHGWQVMFVSDGVGCDHEDDGHPHHDDEHDHDDHGEPGPAFAYTVGLLHRAGHPELLLSGLDPVVMHHVLNDVARRVLRGRLLDPGDALEDVLVGVPLAVEQVAPDALADAVTWSRWFHRRDVDALALVWPTTDDIFPWQPGAPAVLHERQPPAWRVPVEHRGGLAVDPEWEFPVPPDRLAFTCTHVADEGAAVLWVAREPDESRGEDWSVHCGAGGHSNEEMRVLHLAHLVRSTPSLHALGGLGLGEQAHRASSDDDWSVEPLA
ncbi:DUF4262 domain-containing protein [Rothia sp. ARF10]|nr:DUF4262 domain-containing protein [Rothia sp. ARF10]